MKAILNIRKVQGAEDAYYLKTGRYASLDALTESGLISSVPGLGHGLAEGYRFQIQLEAQGYRLTASPDPRPKRLFYSLYSDESKVIRSSFSSTVATAASPRIDGGAGSDD
jgi:hypothetical protein